MANDNLDQDVVQIEVETGNETKNEEIANGTNARQKWIDNFDFTPNQFRGPAKVSGEAQKRLINSLTAEFKKKASRKLYDGNELTRIVFFFSAMIPELRYFRAGGLLEIMRSFENFNLDIEECKAIAETLGASPHVKAGDKDSTTAAVFDVLSNLPTDTFKADPLPEGTAFEEFVPVIRIECCDLLLRLNRGALRYYTLNAVKVASYAGLYKERAGPKTQIYHYADREDSEDFQTVPVYAVQSGWNGTTNKAVADKFGMEFFSTTFEPDVAEDMKNTAEKEGFEKAFETHIEELEKVAKGMDVLSIEATLSTTMKAIRTGNTRFLEVKTNDDIVGFCGALLTFKDYEAKGQFSILISSNFVQLYHTAIDKLQTVYNNYSRMKKVQIVVQMTSMDDLNSDMRDMFSILLLPESGLLPAKRETAWETAFECAISNEPQHGVSYMMLNTEEIWRVCDGTNLGRHVGYHMTAANEKVGPNSVFNLDGSATTLPGTRLSRLTKRLTLDKFAFREGDSCMDVRDKSDEVLEIVESGVKKTYSIKVVKPQ